MEHTSSHPLSYQEFLDFIADKDGRYEYVDGRAVAMRTPSNEHQDLSLVLGSGLRDHLRGQRCKVRLASPLWTVGRDYPRERSPDIMVTCDETDLLLGQRLNRRPKIIVEILSPNEGDDLKDKLDDYEAVETVEEYIIIDSTKRWVRRWYRNAQGKFQLDPYYISGLVRFSSVGYTLDIDTLYDEVGIS
ncbi:MAG: Uma2 family endonuclease [Candidatus Eremiobacteraeota bacterium]|nr:Uma2 family endonuclease [Candidatus Eremiobacteraeota bacterium]